MNEMTRNERESSEERKLELRLAPPGVENWFHTNNKQRDYDYDYESKLSLGTTNYFSNTNTKNHLHFPSNKHVVMRGKESSSSQTRCPKSVELQNGGDNKVTAVSNTSQKRYYTFFLYLKFFCFYFYFNFIKTEDIHSLSHFVFFFYYCGPCKLLCSVSFYKN
jgi:hypothetical protein